MFFDSDDPSHASREFNTPPEEQLSHSIGKILLERKDITAQKMKFSIKGFFSKCDQIRRPGGFVTFTEEILNVKLHFLCIKLCL